MTEAELKSDNERLRAEVNEYKARELADLKSALSAAREEAAHFRNEAQRNADIGREIHATSQESIAMLRAQLEAIKTTETNRIRGNVTSRG